MTDKPATILSSMDLFDHIGEKIHIQRIHLRSLLQSTSRLDCNNVQKVTLLNAYRNMLANQLKLANEEIETHLGPKMKFTENRI